MKYAHLADSHLGSWRDPKMRDLATNTFLQAIDQCIKTEVDFIIFSGDLFNTSLPALDTLKIVTKKLKHLKDQNIPLYTIAGSHDFSPSGKTMIDVLENAGLLINVCKGKVNEETKQLHLNFTIDQKTQAKITGILGRKGQLDKSYYENLNLESLEQESGYKIFLFHTTLTELKPSHLEKVESHPVSFLPKGFNYYAGGHIHHPSKIKLENYGTLTYPGALFPNNFAEIEKYSQGGYYLIDNEQIEWLPLKIKGHQKICLDCSHKSPEVINFELMEQINELDLADKIITLRLSGKLEQGKVSDINFKEIFQQLYHKGAYFVMKNTSQLNSGQFEEIKITNSNPENVEEELIKEHLQQNSLFNEERELELTKTLLHSLNTIKKEGETVTDFQKRVENDINQLLELGE